MKKILLIMTLLCVTVMSFGQSKTFAGVKFGQSYEECKVILDSLFNNKIKSKQNENGKLVYSDIVFANEAFDKVTFDFIGDELVECLFSLSYPLSNISGSKLTVERLHQLYINKYNEISDRINLFGYKDYCFEYDEGHSIYIYTSKAGGLDDIRIKICIYYGPNDKTRNKNALEQI